jgi:hypothetical protein
MPVHRRIGQAERAQLRGELGLSSTSCPAVLGNVDDRSSERVSKRT